MTHIFIEEENHGFSVRYSDMQFHVETFEQAESLALKIGTQLGLIGC